MKESKGSHYSACTLQTESPLTPPPSTFLQTILVLGTGGKLRAVENVLPRPHSKQKWRAEVPTCYQGGSSTSPLLLHTLERVFALAAIKGLKTLPPANYSHILPPGPVF